MWEIALKLSRLFCVVQNYLKDLKNYGKNEISLRQKVLSVRKIRQVSRMASNTVRSANMIKIELGLKASTSTIFRSIKAQPNIIRDKLKKVPCFDPSHMM